MKKIGKVIIIILIVAIMLIIGAVVLLGKLFSGASIQPLTADHKIGVWYSVAPEGAVDSIGKPWHALVRFGTENKVVINFYGGGVSINEDTAKEGEAFYYHTIGDNEFAQEMGISANSDKNPLQNWTFINVPYCTGDWHIGTNDFPYTDNDGNAQILHHHGYTNFKLMMDMLAEYVGMPDAVLVTGWSGGGFGASFLAEEIFEDYFPTAENKTVLVDAAFLLKDDWKDIATHVWGTPEHIANRFTGDNLVLDSLRFLSVNVPSAKILFLCSVRDMALTQYQSYLNTGIFEADEMKGKQFERDLKVMVDDLLTYPNTSVFIWSDQDGDTALTGHTVTMIQFVDAEYGGVKVSRWLMDAVNGELKDYGLELINKVYE